MYVISEFAKEAMNGQSLDQAEILSIRWAYGTYKVPIPFRTSCLLDHILQHVYYLIIYRRP